MIGQDVADSTARQQNAPISGVVRAAADLGHGDAYGTLILDGLGRIRSCGVTGEKILGASQVSLIGRRISDFIAGLCLGGSSPSYSARYLVHLCAEGEWRKFEAIDADGDGFSVELNLSRMVTDGQEVFLLNLRRPETPAA